MNFSNCDDDFEGYNPELYVLKSVANNSKIIDKCNAMNHNEKLNGADEDDNGSINEGKINGDDESITLNVSNMNSDDESYKFESSLNSDDEKSINALKSGDGIKSIDEEEYYGPTFFQRSTHWVCFYSYLFT